MKVKMAGLIIGGTKRVLFPPVLRLIKSDPTKWSTTLCSMRSFTSLPEHQFFTIERDPNIKELAVVKMNNPPVNILSTKFMNNMTATLSDLEKDKDTRAIILTSAMPKMFCAGLDIKGLYQISAEDAADLWRAMQDAAIGLFSTRLITVGALNGHTIAGGCAFALQCDERIMAKGPYTIGIKAAAVGLTVPMWITDSMVRLIGQQKAERAISRGKMFNPEEAAEIGLVDQAVNEKELIDVAKARVKKWLQIPDEARYLTKFLMRNPLIEAFKSSKDQDIQDAVQMLTSQEVQGHIKKYLDSFIEQKR